MIATIERTAPSVSTLGRTNWKTGKGKESFKEEELNEALKRKRRRESVGAITAAAPDSASLRCATRVHTSGKLKKKRSTPTALLTTLIGAPAIC